MRKSIKEQVLEESLDRCKKRLAEIEKIRNSDPKGEAIRLEIETIEKAKELTKQGKHAECSILLDTAIKEYTRLWNMPDPLEDPYCEELLNERIDLDTQLWDLKNELFLVQLCKKQKKL